MHVRVSAERTIHLPVADEDTLLCMVKISPSVSTKRMTWATQQTSHSVSIKPDRTIHGLRDGSLKVLEDVIFSIDNEGAFTSAVNRLRDLICGFKGNPFKESMSYHGG